MSGSRKEVLADAIKAEAGAAPADPETLFTDDVVGWSPYVTVSGLTALAALSALREVAFSNVVITFRGLDEVGNKAFAEWLVEADHTGPHAGRHQVRGSSSILRRPGSCRAISCMLTPCSSSDGRSSSRWGSRSGGCTSWASPLMPREPGLAGRPATAYGRRRALSRAAAQALRRCAEIA